MKKLLIIVLVLLYSIGNAENVKTKPIVKIYNSKEYSKILDNFLIRANKYLETGDKKSLLDDYIENIETARVYEWALAKNYEKDREAFSLVEVAIFMKSSYAEGEEAKKLTDKDYKEMQERFVKTEKFKQLEQHVEIQAVANSQ
ncbi:hypothetical protein [Fusobacterium hwasookii]|uniref:Uncharacterized protein n=2 Tax=Fusobacterium hwasookii TaxID=1583098 RepID=A0AAC9A219_9FUSO|nr:hypothetical protein [Fusobacterium hwasookii]ALQ36366.1 hypothetical protein RN92_10740 [Fusobacterium hwasookii ChDC F206]ALQ37043.1 hypothetical protein RN97_02220 [Fusobacterium hwasookii ChDC F300]EJU07329.1 hypothetical protein B437_08533 [Fusobacterium hwasookii ChDC F128]QNE65663.1 hypothetical protein H5V36_07315 [Fusobacterium hwasookii]QNE67947.1 hypothetical protein H5V38_08465 [Fusobacterium hwasookii]